MTTRRRRTGGLAALAGLLVVGGSLARSATFDNGSWSIELSDSGYSDGMFSPKGHEQLSGEWAAAIRYDGIVGNESMWLESTWIEPDWTTNSRFTVVAPLEESEDPANPVPGFDTGRGVISNGQVEITLDVRMRDGQTSMGLSSNPAFESRVRSYQYVLLTTYTVRNLTPAPLTNVAFYQMMHAHPNDSFLADNYAVYDPHAYADAADAFPDYHYDMTFFAPRATWSPEMDDVVGFSATQAPAAVQIGSFRSPVEGGEPGPESLHHVVEADALNGAAVGGPDEIAGAMKWNLGTLAPGQSTALTILVSTSHSEAGIDPPSACGNGIVDLGEQCDDGNVLDGDCCSARCALQADGTACGSGGDARCATDVCVAGICSDHPACGQIVVADPPAAKKPPIRVSCDLGGRSARGDFCRAQAFAVGPAPASVAGAAQPQAAGDVAITKAVTKRLNRKTGTARLVLRLNKVGKRLLKEATVRGQPLEARVEVTVNRAKEPTLLTRLVRLVGKR